MYCNRLKRKCQCTPRPRSSRPLGAEELFPFYSFFQLQNYYKQNCCTQKSYFNIGPKDKKIRSFGPIFLRAKNHTIKEELL